MNFEQQRLPWRDDPAMSAGNVNSWFTARLPAEFGDYLPATILLYADVDVATQSIEAFLDEMSGYLHDEIRRRLARKARFVELGLFSDAELTHILTGSRQQQPWLLYYSRDGGVGSIDFDAAPERVAQGYKPCSSMTNHGLAWQRQEDRYLTWLVTSRKRGQGWDWDSDIGHESAHAAFAPVPLYTQLLEISALPVAEITAHPQSLTAPSLGRIGYPFSELAVVSVRGEPRATDTHLPVVETPEMLFGLLKLGIELVPHAGFERALQAAESCSGVVDVRNGIEMFEIAAPILRLMPGLAKIATSVSAPTVQWYRTLGAAHAGSFAGVGG
jgi:hypothetical protein